MNGIPKVNPAIQAALDTLKVAQDNLQRVLNEEQEKCSHPIVLQRLDPSETRLCPSCGTEEACPPYHSFWFDKLRDHEDRLIVPVRSDIFKYRVEGSRRVNNPLAKKEVESA